MADPFFEHPVLNSPYWVPGANNLGTHGRWAFAEFTEVYQIESDFKAKISAEFGKMIGAIAAGRV